MPLIRNQRVVIPGGARRLLYQAITEFHAVLLPNDVKAELLCWIEGRGSLGIEHAIALADHEVCPVGIPRTGH